MRTIAGSPGAGGFGVSFGSKTDVLLVWEDEGKGIHRHISTTQNGNFPFRKQEISASMT